MEKELNILEEKLAENLQKLDKGLAEKDQYLKILIVICNKTLAEIERLERKI